MEHAEVYFNILCSVDPKMIPRLSQNDDEIYTKFRADFPDLKVAKLEEMKDLKSAEMKAKWRGFCDEFKHVEDYSFATLIRLDSSQDYEEANSVIVTKIQFYAIELARNREGHNDQIRHNFKPKKRKAKNEVTSEDGFHSNLTQEVQNELQSILGGNHPLTK
eukprot:01547.XXX_3618_4228_1 [CDS] Oithona nana genome sequencing.